MTGWTLWYLSDSAQRAALLLVLALLLAIELTAVFVLVAVWAWQSDWCANLRQRYEDWKYRNVKGEPGDLLDILERKQRDKRK